MSGIEGEETDAQAQDGSSANVPAEFGYKIKRNLSHVDKLVANFDRDGYVVVRGALSQQKVSQLLAAIDQLKPTLSQSLLRKHADVMDADRVVAGLDVRGIVLQSFKDRKTATKFGTLQLDRQTSSSLTYPFLSLLDWPGTFPIAARCLGNPNISLLTSHLIISPPVAKDAARNIGWHTDGGVPQFAGRDGVRAFQQLKIGYYLVDLDKAGMGNLMVVPGSHRRPAILHQSADGADPPGAIELCVRRGDAVIFQQGLWHAGGHNTSTQPRVAIYFGYGARYLRPMDFVPELLPDIFTQACTPIQRQLMGTSSTPLGYYVPQPGDVPLKEPYAQLFGKTHHRL